MKEKFIEGMSKIDIKQLIKRNMEKEIEEDIKVLESIFNGNEECIETILKFTAANEEDEDIKHFKRENKAIENVINGYKREKARADKLETEYSELLTKLDEYETK